LGDQLVVVPMTAVVPMMGQVLTRRAQARAQAQAQAQAQK
jgi:hypothetical protein